MTAVNLRSNNQTMTLKTTMPVWITGSDSNGDSRRSLPCWSSSTITSSWWLLSPVWARLFSSIIWGTCTSSIFWRLSDSCLRSWFTSSSSSTGASNVEISSPDTWFTTSSLTDFSQDSSTGIGISCLPSLTNSSSFFSSADSSAPSISFVTSSFSTWLAICLACNCSISFWNMLFPPLAPAPPLLAIFFSILFRISEHFPQAGQQKSTLFFANLFLSSLVQSKAPIAPSPFVGRKETSASRMRRMPHAGCHSSGW